MRTTIDHAADRPEDWKAPGAALVRSAVADDGTGASAFATRRGT
jgi:hypothetical protein